jgi:beta-N-acetylhexosaminidase
MMFNVNRYLSPLLIVALLAITSLPVRSQQSTAWESKPAKVTAFKRDRSAAAVKWANNELKRMSLEEKVGQLISVGVNATFLNQDSDAFRTLKHHVEDNKIGGIILFRGPVYESVILMNRMQQLARYPLLISADLESGPGMRLDDTINFPWNMAVGATSNPEFARRQGELTAREARALGIHHVFAPVVDVNNNAANPVINVRSYGEDPAEVARFAAAFTQGAQAAGVIATAKHFPGHGDTAVDSHRGLPEINVGRDRLNTIEFVPFQAAVNAGVGSVMVGHIALPQIDATAIKPLPRAMKSKPINTDEANEIIEENVTIPATLSPVMGRILRNDLKFSGMILTDALDMSGLTIYFTQEEAAARAVEAGADMLLKPADIDAAFRGVRDAVKSGRITEQRVEESARKVLAAKYDLGLLEQRLTPVEAIDRIVGSKDVVALANEIAERAVTLVRDEDKLLALRNLKPDARVFNLAITNGDDRNWITNPFVTRLTRTGLQIETMVLDQRSSDREVQKAVERAKSSDLVIASLYGRVRSGQASSVGIPDSGARALSALIAARSPIVGISFGNPYLLQNFPGLRTYLVAYGDMPSLQHAVARALMGEIDIAGRLPISLPGLYPRGTGIQLKAAK